MKIQVLYFARLRETFGLGSESCELQDDATVNDLITHLRARGGEWHMQLAPEKAYRVAVDQEIASMEAPLHGGAEVAIFPPVTGG